jgi:hypothetical protein
MPDIITDNHLPCFVSGGKKIENPALAKNKRELYQITARNFLRHFTYGTKLFYGNFSNITNLKLCWYIFKALMVKKDVELLDAIRSELKQVFCNICQQVEKLNPDLQDRLEVFVNTLVSNFAFLDPKEGEEVILPQKIDSIWLEVSYRFKKIDISPKQGWRAKLLEAEDRIYAYGLEPSLAKAHPYLLLMGTTYLTGQGAYLSLLSNITPGLSVGESHDLSELEKWMRRQLKVKVTGHSQGGTMAMLVTAKYSEYTHSAYCLNPAILHKGTLLRLKQLGGEKINVYIQERDPVFIIGDFLMEGTRVFHVTHPHIKKYSRVAAHALHFSGHPEAIITEIKTPHVDSDARKFFNDFKYFADRILSPFLSINFITSILLRKWRRVYNHHAKLFQGLLFSSLVLANIFFLITGILKPAELSFIAPFLTHISPIVAYPLLILAALMVSGLSTYLIPRIVSLANKFLIFVLTMVGFLVTGSALLLGAGCACLLLFARATNEAPSAGAAASSSKRPSAKKFGGISNSQLSTGRPNVIYPDSVDVLAENLNKVSAYAVAIQIGSSTSQLDTSLTFKPQNLDKNLSSYKSR